MNHWLDRIQILCGGSLGISDDLITFWEESIKNKMVDGGHFEKNSHLIAAKKLVGTINFEPLV